MIVLEEQPVAGLPDETTRRTIRQWAALIALGVMFLVVTKGPVYWVRLEAAPLSGSFISDVWIQVAFVTSAALVLAIAAPGARVIAADRLVMVVFAVFLLAVVASSIWSVAVSESAQQSTMFLLGTTAALIAGAYLRRFDVLVTLWLAMQVGLALSIFAWWRDWPLAVDGVGKFAGIYLNKNSLGPVAILGFGASVALALAAWRSSLRLIVPVAAVCAAVDALAWVRSRSYTPLLGLTVAAAVVVLLSLFVPGRSVRIRRWVGVVALVATAVLGAVVVAGRDRVNEWLDRPNTLSGRSTIWDIVLEYTAERPIGGWGFSAVWAKPDIIESLRLRGRMPVFEAHSGYLEVLVGVGVVGLVLLVVVVVVVVARVIAAMWRSPSVLSAWSVALVAFAVAANFVETYVGPNLIVWTLLCVAAGQAVAVLQASPVAPAGDAEAAPIEAKVFVETPPAGIHIQTVSDDFGGFDFSFDDAEEWGDTGDGESGDEIAVAP